jgi:hypothetical protein
LQTFGKDPLLIACYTKINREPNHLQIANYGAVDPI